jgi:hypothetical protein
MRIKDLKYLGLFKKANYLLGENRANYTPPQFNRIITANQPHFNRKTTAL